MPTDRPIDARVFGAIRKAFVAEGFSEDEAYKIAKRGADLLTASDASSPGSPQPRTGSLSKLLTTRRMVLVVLVMSVGLVAFTFIITVLELARASRSGRLQARSPVPRNRVFHLQISFIAILAAVFAIFMLNMPGS